MPTYQYACTACGHQLEAVQSFTDDALVECPECAGRLRKLFGSVGIVFKGSGFYRTDSRSAPAESTASSSESSTTKAESTAGSNGAKKESATPSKESTSSSGGSSSSGTSSSSKSTATAAA